MIFDEVGGRWWLGRGKVLNCFLYIPADRD
jgi:hypothetical protein